MKHRKRLVAVALALAVFFGMGVNAYAEEPPTPINEETTQAEIEQLTSISEEDPPATEEGEIGETPVVYNIEELQAAIDAANDGDTILIGAKIFCAESVTIGSLDKSITLNFADDFSGQAMFRLLTQNEQKITMQNLVLNGETTAGINAHVVDVNLISNPIDTQGTWYIEDVTIKNFNSNWSVFAVYDADATFYNCHFENNYGHRSGGIEIFPNASAEIMNCTFYNNRSCRAGAAIRCYGNTKIKETAITGNQAINDGTVTNGGGIYVDAGASCEVLSCAITGNAADLGGGISCKGILTVSDTLIYGNTGSLGGHDIRGFSGANISVEYTDSMTAIYTENSPVGFYRDDFESVFNAETNAEFVGETISVQNNTNNNLGVKFVFEGDLPTETTTPEEDIPPQEDDTDIPSDDTSDDSRDNPANNSNTPPPTVVYPPYIGNDTSSSNDTTGEDNNPSTDDIAASDNSGNTGDDTMDTEPIVAPVPPTLPVVEDNIPLPDTNDIQPSNTQDTPTVDGDEETSQESKADKVPALEDCTQQEKENTSQITMPTQPQVEAVEDQTMVTDNASVDTDTENDTPVVAITMGTLVSLAAGVLGIFRFKRRH